MIYCKKCVMVENKPHIFFNDEGICNLCVEFDKHKKSPERQLETDLIQIINKHKGKQKYDCLVMCSGGKDSTASLYYMKKRYGLNVLAFTFDHGFESHEALENIKNAVEILDVDFMYFKSDFMKPLFKRILSTNSKAVICHPCSIWYMDLAYQVAEKYKIPMIVAGWTKGQSVKQPIVSKCGCGSNLPEFVSMSEATAEFFDKEIKSMPQYKNFPNSMQEVQKRANKRHKSIVISPLWFLPFDSNEYINLIKNELKWKVPKISYPGGSTNCMLNFISVHNSMKNFGYTHYHVEMSKLIREGLITRSEAIKKLEINFDKKLLNEVGEKLDYKFS